MRTLLCLLVFACVLAAQTPATTTGLPSDFVGAGASYNPQGSPTVAGMALYAHRISGVGTFSFTLMDIFPSGIKPFKVTTAVTSGIAQKIKTIGTFEMFSVGTIGYASANAASGWAWTAGGGVAIPLGRGWSLVPNGRVMKSSVSDFAYAGGLIVGIGK